MSTPGSGGRPKPRLGGLGGRLGGKRKPAPTSAPRTGWQPKGSAPSGGSPGGAGGPARSTPPARTNRGQGGSGNRPGGSGAGAKGRGGPSGNVGSANERSRSPRQFLPGAKDRDAGADPHGTQDADRNIPPDASASGTSRSWSGLGYSAVDYFMLIPGFAVAWYGGQLIQQCAVEASGKVAFALWLMIGFWVALATARWPAFRMLRWAWVLAGVLGAFAVPG